MIQLIAFLIGVITSATTGLGEKTQAALRMVGLDHGEDIPPAYRYLVQADGTTTAVPVPAAVPTDHGLIGNWLHAMASNHPILSLTLAVLVGLYILYKVRAVTSVFARSGGRS